MEKEEKVVTKNSTGLVLLVVAMTLVVSLFVGFILGQVYAEKNNEKSDTNGVGNNSGVTNGDEKEIINNWVDYLFAQEITAAEIHYEYYKSDYADPSNIERKTVKITTEQLKELLKDAGSDGIATNDACGLGGFGNEPVSHLVIDYRKQDGTQYVFSDLYFLSSVKNTNFEQRKVDYIFEDEGLKEAVLKTADEHYSSACSEYLYMPGKRYLATEYFKNLVK